MYLAALLEKGKIHMCSYIVYVVHVCVSVQTSSFATKTQRVTSTKKMEIWKL